MDAFEVEAIQLELKYCERCGGLWLRLRGSDLVLCAACTKAIKEMPGGMRSRHRRALASPEHQLLEQPINHDERTAVEVFWMEGGNA
jgi:Zn-finger nucleic acid-binding protein